MKKIILDYINYENIKIARENIGYSIFYVDNKISNTNIEKIEQGEIIPTLSKLKLLAIFYNVPYLLFLSKNKIPKRNENEVPKDFRDISLIKIKDNPVLNKMIHEMIIKQKNIERILLENNLNIHFEFENNIISNPKDMADYIIENIGLNLHEFREQPDYDTALKYLINKIEEKNIFVFKTYSSQVEQPRGPNKKLNGISINDMKGLSLYNKYAPFIIIHRQDGPTSKIFTLLHELTHIFRRSSTISNIQEYVMDFRDGEINREEVFCNRVAAEILLSNIEYDDFYNYEQIRNKAIELKVSRKTLFIKLKQLNKIKGDVEIIEKEINNKLDYKENKTRNKGGNYYNSMKDSNSTLYTNIIHSAYLEERINYIEAHNLLGMNPEKI